MGALDFRLKKLWERQIKLSAVLDDLFNLFIISV